MRRRGLRTPSRSGRGEQALRAWLEQHAQTGAETLRALLRAPVATLLTVAAVAVALALPAVLYLTLKNLEQLGGDWHRSAAVAVFLETAVDEAVAAELAAELTRRRDIEAVDIVSRARGLAEFREYSGLGGALDQLDYNPLPVVLLVRVRPERITVGLGISGGNHPPPPAPEALIKALEALPEVAFARFDAQWALRLKGLLDLLRSAALLLGAALGLAALLVIGNTVRLEIENRREAILVMDLVGATPGFVRRPFLYSGAWYGLLSGTAAWLLVMLGVWLLGPAVGRLAALYHSDYRLIGLALTDASVLIAAGVLLGIAGSWVAVWRQLQGIGPD